MPWYVGADSAEATGQLGGGGAADDGRHAGVGDGVGGRADRDDGLAAEPSTTSAHPTYIRQARCGSTPLKTTRSWAPPVRRTWKSLRGQLIVRLSPSTISTIGRSCVKS